MLIAIISYILLNLFLALAKAKSGGNVDEGRKAEMIAKVSRIVNTINRLVAIWFKFLLWLFIIAFAAAFIALCISIFGISLDSAWIATIELWKFGTIAQLVEKFGMAKAISAISVSLVLLAGLSYLAVWLLTNKRLWQHKS